MPDLGPHAIFIIGAYIGVGLVTIGLVAVTLGRAAAARRRLALLEARRDRDAKA